MDFFKKTRCDRCHSSLDGGRILSMYNEQTICMICKKRNSSEPTTARRSRQTMRKSARETTTSKASAWTTERKHGGGNAPQPKGKHHGKGY